MPAKESATAAAGETELTQLSYLAHALVANARQWKLVIDAVREEGSDASDSPFFGEALKRLESAFAEMGQAEPSTEDIKRVVEKLVKTDDPAALSAARALAWAIENLPSQPPPGVRRSAPHR